ncbi:hypothetical protein RYZ27_08315 [Hyphomonas sp. FCG-A18]|uniref:hypothetical protein n=1 Tax=Hyphomonas sp. FCG-A18 TaxID=3080019 RepID=UPI002B288828|nr:hypothetical protein RYZ27_08315 [Hyphomonas sp. FCG-A18]
MADLASLDMVGSGAQASSMSEAISLLQSGAAEQGLSLALGDRVIAFSADDIASGGALQRLLGLQRVLNTLRVPRQDKVQPLRSGKPVLHPRVAEILDALR